MKSIYLGSGNTMGLHVEQANVLLEALSQSDYKHTSCPATNDRTNCVDVDQSLKDSIAALDDNWHQDEIDGLCKLGNE